MDKGKLALSTLINPSATIAQLKSPSSQLDGVPRDLEDSIRFAGCRLTQAAGVLLRLPQETIARAIVIYTRFWVGSEGGSLKEHGAHDISAACIYLITKLSFDPRTPRSVINVYAYLAASHPRIGQFQYAQDSVDYCVTEGDYQVKRDRMMKHEGIILRTLGFDIHVALPYSLCINYLQALETFQSSAGKALAARAFAQINTLLLSPQIVFLTHQPSEIATAAIYLAAKETGIRLPEDEWWEVFDTGREQLGFLVAAMTSMSTFSEEEMRRWTARQVPMSVGELEIELETRQAAG